MLREIKENGFFIHNYRMLMGGKTVSASLRAAMVEEDDGEKIFLALVLWTDKPVLHLLLGTHQVLH